MILLDNVLVSLVLVCVDVMVMSSGLQAEIQYNLVLNKETDHFPSVTYVI